MNTAQEFPGVTSLRQWMLDVAEGGKYTNVFHPSCLPELLAMADNSMKIPKYLGGKGIKCSGRWVGDISKTGFTLTANGCEFKCMPVNKGPRPQAVTQTSKAAYHTIDFSTQRGKIAEAIWNESKTGKDVTRQELSILHSFEKNAVCGRVNELLKASQEAPFEFEGRRYRLVVTEPRLSRFKGASNVKNEGLRWWPVEAEQTKLF